jgi:hypothetical protein
MPDYESWLWLGITHVVVGGANIALSIWGNCMKQESNPGVSISPIIMPDADGNAAFGIGMQLVNW